MIRVLLIGDPALPQGDLVALLVGAVGIELVGQFGFPAERDREAAVARVVAERLPSVLIVNTDYAISQILPIVAALKARVPQCAVVILVDPSKRGMLPPRQRANRLSFLAKDVPAAVLVETVRRAARGEPVIHPRLALATLATNERLSLRELEILGLAAEGASVAEIADRLCLARGTVRNYLSAVIAKTGARNRIDAIRIVRKDGWLR